MPDEQKSSLPPRPPAPWEVFPPPWQLLQQQGQVDAQTFLGILANFPDKMTVGEVKSQVNKQIQQAQTGEQPKDTRGYRSAGNETPTHKPQADNTSMKGKYPCRIA